MSTVLAERSFHCLIDYGKELIVCWFQFEWDKGAQCISFWISLFPFSIWWNIDYDERFPTFDRWPLDSFGFLLDNGGTLLWHWTCYFGGFLLLICCCLHGLYFGYLQETWASLREDSHTAVSVPLSIKVCTDLLMKFIDEGPHSHFLVLDNNGIIWWLEFFNSFMFLSWKATM